MSLMSIWFNKTVSENDPVESEIPNDGKKNSERPSTHKQKHHSLLLQLLASRVGCEPDDICDFELQACDTQPSIVAGAMKAKTELKISAVADNLSGKSKLSEVRTSSGMFIRKAKDSIVDGIEDKIAT